MKSTLLALAVLTATLQAQPALDPTAALLTEIIRIDTSNPPGHEGQIAALLEQKFRPLGFEITIVPTPEAGKAHFIARLKGDGSRRPVLLAAHADVVGVEREKWSVDPFAGLVKDGDIYGRGAIDFKGGMAVFARAILRLAENKVPLSRDVIFLVEADEEAAQYNTSWLARTHWPQMDCEFALNEGGWIIKDRRRQGAVREHFNRGQVVGGGGGDGARHLDAFVDAAARQPDLRAGQGVGQTGGSRNAGSADPEHREFFATLARTSAPPLSDQFRALLGSDPDAVARADKAISSDPLLHAIMRNTIAPVLMNAGFRSNVIPGSAEATVNVRIIPGTDPNDIVREFERVMADPAISVRLSSPSAGPSTLAESSHDTDLYRALVRQAKATFPGAEVTPYLFQAGTDAGAWRSRGVPVYGIYPYPITADELTRMHGNDEKVSVESLRLGTEMIYQTLVDVAGKK